MKVITSNWENQATFRYGLETQAIDKAVDFNFKSLFKHVVATW